MLDTMVENRREARTDLTWPISVWLPEANRFFNAQTVNVAKGGVLVSMPMTTPVRAGHAIELNFPRTKGLAEKKGQFARIKGGKVLRVDRASITTAASINVAIQFE